MSAAQQPLFVNSDEALRALCEQLAPAPWLAVDTEFVRERTYYPVFCLLQVSDGDRIALVDTLAVTDLAPLRALLYDPDRTLVLHAASQDLEIFAHLWNALPPRVFDTQVAAAAAGLGDQMGYAALVRTLLGVSLEKAHTRTDWCQRPLTRDQMSYAADDVRYLARLYPLLRERLETQGRGHWLEEDFDDLLVLDRYRTAPAEAWKRVKGLHRLPAHTLGTVAELAAWREAAAQERDRPRGWLMKDDAITALALHPPAGVEDLAQVRGLSGDVARDHGPAIIEACARGAAAEPPALRAEEPLDAEGLIRRDLLDAVLRALAAELDLDSTTLSGRRDLERLVQGQRDIRVLRGWRRHAAGEHLRALAEGEAVVRLKDGGVEVRPA